MKRKILLTAVVAAWLVGSSAFASIARLAVMGTQPSFTAANQGAVTTNVVNGSLWYDDDYNMFYNPATIVDNKNFVSFDKGLEGGWVSSVGDSFAYGVYVNRGGSAAAAYGATANLVAPGINTATVTSYAGAGNNNINTQRAIDILFGGDTGIKWGVDITWAYNRNQTIATTAQNDLEATNRYWHVTAGAEIMGFEPFIGTTLSSKFQRNNADSSAQANDVLDDMNVGLRYKYEAWTPYATYRKWRRAGSGPGVTDNTATGSAVTQVQTNFDIVGIGVGHDSKIADGVHVMKNVGVYYNSVGDTAGTTFNLRDYKEYMLPLNVALEAEATSWLTLRAGLEYYVWAERKLANLGTSNATAATAATDKRTSLTARTTVRLGSTFKFGKLHVDSAFGNGTALGTDNVGAATDTTSIGFDSNTFALVSASYHW